MVAVSVKDTREPEPIPAQPPSRPRGADVIIDCDTCTVRGDACSDCVVAVLLGGAPVLDTQEQQAIEVLAASGLVPPLRLAPAPDVTDDTPDRSTRAV